MGDEKEFDRTVLVARKIMNDAKQSLAEAKTKEDYSKANELEHYIAGMNQAILVFVVSKNKIFNMD